MSFGGQEPRRSKRGLLLAGGGIVGALAIGAGALTAVQFFSTGAQPAEMLPADTIAYVSVDLDPSGGQKIEALRLARKFPAFKDKVGLGEDDDIRKKIFDELAASSDCKLDFEKDVDSWLGSRAAFAAVGADDPQPVAVIQVDGDVDEGLKKLQKCGDGSGSVSEGGWVRRGDWVVVAESKKVAERVADDAEKSSLADADGFTTWTDRAGDPGIASFYIAKSAGQVLSDRLGDLSKDLGGLEGRLSGSSSGSSSGSDGTVEDQLDLQAYHPDVDQADQPDIDTLCSEEMLNASFTREDCEKLYDQIYGAGSGSSSPAPGDEVATPSTPASPFGSLLGCQGAANPGQALEPTRKMLERFSGAAGALRFDDGGVSLEVVTSNSINQGIKPGSGTPVTGLPEDTAAALALAFPKNWVQAYTQQIEDVCGDGFDVDAMMKQLGDTVGLDLPGDLETLLGDSFAVTLGSGFDPEAIANSSDMTDLPVAVKVEGDADDIDAVLDKVRKRLPAEAAELFESTKGDDAIALGPDASFRKKVAGDGSLSDNETFSGVVPEADKAAVVLYVNVNELDKAIESLAGGDQQVLDNLKPAKALGMSSWLDGDTVHVLLRATTD